MVWVIIVVVVVIFGLLASLFSEPQTMAVPMDDMLLAYFKEHLGNSLEITVTGTSDILKKGMEEILSRASFKKENPLSLQRSDQPKELSPIEKGFIKEQVQMREKEIKKHLKEYQTPSEDLTDLIEEIGQDGLERRIARLSEPTELFCRGMKDAILYKLKSEFQDYFFIWIPSSSVNPDTEHMAYYGKKYYVDKKSIKGFPAYRWGCQCCMALSKKRGK